MIWVTGQDATSSAGAVPAPLPEVPSELRVVADQLRQARESQGITQSDLAQRLHMGLQQLQALEQADRCALPEPVFVIAQARRVAAALGLEIGEAIDQLRRCQSFGSQGPELRPEAFARPSSIPSQPAESAVSELGPSAGTRALRLGALLALAAGVSLAGWQLQRRTVVSGSASRPALSSSPAQSPQPKPQTQPQSQGQPQLLLQAQQPSWVEVRRQADGAVLFRGTLSGERRFALDQDLRVLAGRPDLLLVSRDGGPAQLLGPISAVRWVSFAAAPLPSR
jgi:transcriptional regulator with XRE-family HTH domain